MSAENLLPFAFQKLRILMIAAPLFIISVPELLTAQCKACIVGAFPALTARKEKGQWPLLDAWLPQVSEALDRHNLADPDTPTAPFAINQIVHLRDRGRRHGRGHLTASRRGNNALSIRVIQAKGVENDMGFGVADRRYCRAHSQGI